MHSTLDFCHRPARMERNVLLHKNNLDLTVLIHTVHVFYHYQYGILHGYKFPSGKFIYFTFMKPLSKLPCNITTWSSGPWLILFHHCSALQSKGTYSAVSFDGPPPWTLLLQQRKLANLDMIQNWKNSHHYTMLKRSKNFTEGRP